MKILVALDNSTYGEYLSYELNHDRHQVCLVANGLEALNALKQESWDCLVIGVALNYMTGLEVIEQYNEFLDSLSEEEKKSMQDRPVSIIVVTRIRNEKIRQNAYALGVSDYMLLPLKTSLLMDKIDHL